MTQFEIIILIIIYTVCYGYIFAMFSKEKNVCLKLLFAIISLAFAFYAPLIFGHMLFKKLKGE